MRRTPLPDALVAASPSLLGAGDPPSYRVEGGEARSPFVLTCDHAGRALPRSLGALGLSEPELASHVAWDLGIAELGQTLARELDAFAIFQTYSRLVIDVNRPLDTPESIVTRSERTEIRGNLGLTPEDTRGRAEAVFWPYHRRIQQELDRRAQLGRPSILVALHSFTPVYLDVPRPMHVGVLYGRDTRLAHALLQRLRSDPRLIVGDNEPYGVSDDTDYTLLVHGEQRGIPCVELEFRQDLLADEAERTAWARRFAALLTEIRARLFPA